MTLLFTCECFQLPQVSLASMNEYLIPLGKVLKMKNPEKLYAAGYIVYIRSAVEDEHCYVKGLCRAEMRKGTSYLSDIKFTIDGTV